MSGTELAKVIKRLAADTNAASQPDTMLFGKVIEADPLEIQINEKLILKEGSNVLVVPKYIKTMRMPTEPPSPPYIKPGDTVIMIRTQGGRKFVLMDVV